MAEVSLKAAKKAIAIGIDPDVEKSGFAYYNRESGDLELRTFAFLDLLEILKDLERKEDTVVYVEAGWLNKPSNYRNMIKKGGKWIPAPAKVKERMASKTGRNEQVGRLIIEACQRYEIDCIAVRPRSRKTTPEMFERITKRKESNQEKIDAAMLIVDANINRV